jgi:WD40-like Beta Propeller Repeat
MSGETVNSFDELRARRSRAIARSLRTAALFGCLATVAFTSTSRCEETYKTTATEIVSGGALIWCDNDHLLLAATQSSGVEYPMRLLDLQTMREAPIRMMDSNGRELTPIFACKEREFLSYSTDTTNPADRTRQLFVGQLGKPAKRIAHLKVGGRVNLAQKYIVAIRRRYATDSGYAIDADCTISSDSEYRIFCWDVWDTRLWLLSRFVISEYVWRDFISVEAADGQRRQVRNKEPRLIARDGAPVTRTYQLRDFKNRLAADLESDPVFKIQHLNLAFNPDETYAYAGCIRKGASRYDEFWSVCRFRLDGNQNNWEEVFVFDLARTQKTSLGDLSVGTTGDVYFRLPGASLATHRGIWKFNAATHQITQITRVANLSQRDTGPSVSPDGKRVAFTRPEGKPKLFIAEKQEGATK